MKKFIMLVFIIILISVLCSCSVNTVESFNDVETIDDKEVISSIMFDFVSAQKPKELIAHSECVIIGNIKFVSKDTILYDRSNWDEADKQKYGNKNTLYTIYEVTISEVYKGDFSVGKVIYLSMPYGENSEYIVENNQYPKLDNEKDYLLFLSKSSEPDTKGKYEYYNINLPAQGCIPCDFDSNNKYKFKDSILIAFPDCMNYNNIINAIKLNIN